MKSKIVYNPISHKSRKKLRRLLGSRFLEKEEDLITYAYDASGQEFLPEAIALPETAKEIASILKIANENLFPVIPRGAGTSTTGAPLAVAGGLVLSLSRMDKILEINEEDLIAIVEPGVFTGILKEEVAKRGLFYPPDPASYKFSTIGGNVATGAGGPKGLKYGVTKDYVLGLEVVLPKGEIVFLGTRTVKGVVGYDLVHLFIGSEGTLGVITKIILKLLPKPYSQAVALVGFSSLTEAVIFFSSLLKEGFLPSTAELMDSLTIKAVSKFKNFSSILSCSSLLLLEFDGSKCEIEDYMRRIRKKCRSFPFYQEAWGEERENLWDIRRSISPALKRVAPNKISDDIVVPRSKIKEFLKYLQRVSSSTSIKIACFGHMGDGNLHINLLFDAKEPKQKQQAQECRKKILEKVLALSGTISGEHGIGFSKRSFFPKEISPSVEFLMKKIKKIFDPQGILNPFKIFPEKDDLSFSLKFRLKSRGPLS